jgi:hypothetical protein
METLEKTGMYETYFFIPCAHHGFKSWKQPLAEM